MAQRQTLESQVSPDAGGLNPVSANYSNWVPPVDAFQSAGGKAATSAANLLQLGAGVFGKIQEEQAKVWTANAAKEFQLNYQDKFANKEISSKDQFDKIFQKDASTMMESAPNEQARRMIKTHLDQFQLSYRGHAISIQDRLSRASITNGAVEYMDKTTQQMVSPQTPIESLQGIAEGASSFVNTRAHSGILEPQQSDYLKGRAKSLLTTAYDARASYAPDAEQILNHVTTEGTLGGLTYQDSQPIIFKSQVTKATNDMVGKGPQEMAAIVSNYAPDPKSPILLENQTRLHDHLQRVYQANMESLKNDSIAYISQRPEFQESKAAKDEAFQMWSESSRMANTPEMKKDAMEAQQRYDQARNAHIENIQQIQDSMGIPRYQQTILSKGEANAIKEKLYENISSGNTMQMASYLEGLKFQFGDNYGAALNSIGDMDAKLAIASSIVGKDEFKPFLDYTFLVRDQAKKGQEFKPNIDTESKKTIEALVTSGFSEYKTALLNQNPMNQPLAESQQQELINYATYLVSTGVDPKAAAERVVKNTVNASHSIIEASSGSQPTIIPNGFSDSEKTNIQKNLSVVFHDMTSLRSLIGGSQSPLVNPSFSSQYKNQNTIDEVTKDRLGEFEKNGYWALAPNQRGVVFMSKDRGGVPYMPKGKDGNPFTVEFDEIKTNKPSQRLISISPQLAPQLDAFTGKPLK